jgi:hypothetical protein
MAYSDLYLFKRAVNRLLVLSNIVVSVIACFSNFGVSAKGIIIHKLWHYVTSALTE